MINPSPWLLMLLVCCTGAAAAPPDGCGADPNPLNPTTPNVLLVGDVISAEGSGYLLPLQRLLSPGPLATVQHVSSGALTSSTDAVQCIGKWLGGGNWDVVVIAIGLGDCVTNARNTTTDTNTNLLDGTVFLANLKTIMAAAAASGGSGSTPVPVIYATATPFSSTSALNINQSCVKENNQAAKAAMPTKATAVATTATTAAAAAGERCPVSRVADLERSVEQYCAAGSGSATYTRCRIQNEGSLLFNTSDSNPSGLYVHACG